MYPLTDAICIKMQEKPFRNVKDEIILEVFKINHLKAYEQEYWRLCGYQRIISEDHQNCLLDKREKCYDKSSICKKIWEIFL